MYQFRNQKITASTTKYEVLNSNCVMTWRQVLAEWQSEENFRNAFIELLAESPFSAFRWETPAVTLNTVDRPFEFVLIDAPDLDLASGDSTFADPFRGCEPAAVMAFENLGKDATLIVPTPDRSAVDFVHLAGFTRSAKRVQQHQFWQQVGKAMLEQLSDAPICPAPWSTNYRPYSRRWIVT